MAMNKPVVQLDRPNSWMLWRIYRLCQLQSGGIYLAEGSSSQVQDEGWDLQVSYAGGWPRPRYVHHMGDPIDEDGYDDATAFPSVKPDRDLFGPPRRCRTQRGWYYVKPWPPVPNAVPAAPQNLATGSDIPPELFNSIVQYCEYTVGWCRTDTAALRLVCHHWEKLCLPKMLSYIALRTDRNVADGLALVDWRAAHGWTPYPVEKIVLIMNLQLVESWRPWLALPTLLPKLPTQQTEAPPSLSISGPLPAGRRLTSVYLSSPCRLRWCPLPIVRLNLHNLYFRKLDDIVLLLRELPSLEWVFGTKVTWDAPRDEYYPRLRSFIPSSRPHHSIEYGLNLDQPDLSRILVCALSLSGSRSMAQGDANILYDLVSALRPCRSAPIWMSIPHRFKSGLFIGTGETWPNVLVRFRPTQRRTQSVQLIAFDFIDTTVPLDSTGLRMDKAYGDCIFGFIEKHVGGTRPLLVFVSVVRSTEIAELISRKVSAFVSLIAQGRIKYVLEDQEEDDATLRLVESNEIGGWRVLATGKYANSADKWTDRYDFDVSGSWAHVLHALATWSSHQQPNPPNP